MTSITRNLEEELGFRGPKVSELKPPFKQIAYFFDFAKQVYDLKRSRLEALRNRPTKGKIYHLALMEYTGPKQVPLSSNHEKTEFLDFRWSDEQTAISLIESGRGFNSPGTDFNVQLLPKCLLTYRQTKSLTEKQPSLI